MAQSNPAEQYQHRIADIIQRFVNSMRDSRARVDINSSREDGFCIVELTLWRCRTCPDHLYLFRTLFYMRKQYNITILQRHLDAIVWTYVYLLDQILQQLTQKFIQNSILIQIHILILIPTFRLLGIIQHPTHPQWPHQHQHLSSTTVGHQLHPRLIQSV